LGVSRTGGLRPISLVGLTSGDVAGRGGTPIGEPVGETDGEATGVAVAVATGLGLVAGLFGTVGLFPQAPVIAAPAARTVVKISDLLIFLLMPGPRRAAGGYERVLFENRKSRHPQPE